MHRMVYEHLRSPESARRNLLGSPSPHVDFSRVYKTVLWKETTGLSYQDTGKGRQNITVSHKRNQGSEYLKEQGSPLPPTSSLQHSRASPLPALDSPIEELECPELFFPQGCSNCSAKNMDSSKAEWVLPKGHLFTA